MKMIKIYIAAFIVLTCLGACNKSLDINPVESIDASTAIKTSKDVQGVLVGTYNRMGVEDLYAGRIYMEPDLLASPTNMIWTGSYVELTEISAQAILKDNLAVQDNWLASYVVINQANTVLANLSKADGDDSVATRTRWEGEAKFIRGMMYFDMVRLYGRAWNDGDPSVNLGVPIVLEATTSVNSQGATVARSTVKQCYDQAISDLKTAEADLPEDNDFYASKYAATAILARLYLQQGDYVDALKEADAVIESGDYKLLDDYTKEFLPFKNPGHAQNSDEDIFAIQVTPQQGTNALNEFYAASNFGGRGDITISDDFISSYESGDVRGQFYGDDGSTMKFNNQYGNIHVVRLAEMYLIRAEANLHNHTTTGASPQSDVNLIRARAGLAALPAVTIDDVLTERVHELAFEGGFFLHDAKRLEQSIGNLPYNSPKLIFPIPLREILVNPKLAQNEGY